MTERVIYIMGKWNFYTIGQKNDVLFGIGYTHKRDVKWMFDMQLDKVILHKSMASAEFEKELRTHLQSEEKQIKEGFFKNHDKRVDEAREILLHRNLYKTTYGVK